MDDVGDFLSTVLPLMRDEVVGIHEGTAATRLAVWSHTEPVTHFGAEMSRRGWDQLEPAFEGLAASFSGSEAFENEVVAAGGRRRPGIRRRDRALDRLPPRCAARHVRPAGHHRLPAGGR